MSVVRDLKNAQAKIAELEAVLGKAKSEQHAAEADLKAAKAERAAQGAKPVVKPVVKPGGLIDQMNAITDPTAKALFYKANRAAIKIEAQKGG